MCANILYCIILNSRCMRSLKFYRAKKICAILCSIHAHSCEYSHDLDKDLIFYCEETGFSFICVSSISFAEVRSNCMQQIPSSFARLHLKSVNLMFIIIQLVLLTTEVIRKSSTTPVYMILGQSCL
jgi:hypothetical protein